MMKELDADGLKAMGWSEQLAVTGRGMLIENNDRLMSLV